MTNREILLKAIRKAEANGFKLSNDKHTVGIEEDLLGLTPEDPKLLGYQSIIFDQDFAKAFWPEQDDEDGHIVCDVLHPEGQKCSWEYDWRDHLQQMVLEEDPIKYLEKYV